MTEKRQYSKAEKAAWGAEQDRIRAADGITARLSCSFNFLATRGSNPCGRWHQSMARAARYLRADTGKATEPGEAADRRHFRE
jgi:hypothetical protein